jgi:hypothetical protein
MRCQIGESHSEFISGHEIQNNKIVIEPRGRRVGEASRYPITEATPSAP